MNCGICFNQISKYKCPGCLVRYCSVTCYGTHKGKCTRNLDSAGASNERIQKASNATNLQLADEVVESEDILHDKHFRALESSEKLKHILNNTHLREMIKYINTSQNVAEDLKQAMTEPIFAEFVHECVSTVEEP